jgi:hypothetical protein
MTPSQWPIMNLVLQRVFRGPMMARHKASQIQVACALDPCQADRALAAPCACFQALDIQLFLCGPQLP